MRVGKQRGTTYHSDEEYLQAVIEPAFQRMRSFSKRDGKGDETKIHDKDSLLKFIKDVTGTGTSSQKSWFSKTEEYQKLKEENRKQAKEEIQIRKEVSRVTTNDRAEAKERKLVFIGVTKRGRAYAYNYATKKIVSPKKYA